MHNAIYTVGTWLAGKTCVVTSFSQNIYVIGVNISEKTSSLCAQVMQKYARQRQSHIFDHILLPSRVELLNKVDEKQVGFLNHILYNALKRRLDFQSDPFLVKVTMIIMQ